jgi:hypothetical protein
VNFDLADSRSDGERHMRADVRQLALDSLAILRRFDPRALVIALISTLVLLILTWLRDTSFLLLPLFGASIYVGAALLWERSTPVPTVPEPLSLEEEAFDRMRGSTTRVIEKAAKIGQPDIRERVNAIGQTFNTMLDVMDEDKDRTQLESAPEYEVRVVGPFEQKLDYYVYLSDRRVELAAPQLARFEQVELARYEVLTKSFYQHYHDFAVIDFTALLEIFERDDESEDDDLTSLLETFENGGESEDDDLTDNFYKGDKEGGL